MSDPNCEKCHGKGKIECATCNRGKIVCKKCQGKGKFRNCIKCNSTGKVDCVRCEGTGKDYLVCSTCKGEGYIKKIRLVNCSHCYGKGYKVERDGYRNKCLECGGSGQLKESYREICPRCKGAKRIYNERPCPSCGGSLKVECPRCEGTGKAKCQECNGSGKISCEVCHGEGVVKCPDCEKKEREAEERRKEKAREIRAREDAKRRKADAIRAKREEEERKAKERKDAAQGCGCLLAIIAIVAFFIWWWIEGFTMSAITDLWNTDESAGQVAVSSSAGNIGDYREGNRTSENGISAVGRKDETTLSSSRESVDDFSLDANMSVSEIGATRYSNNETYGSGDIEEESDESFNTVGVVLGGIVALFIGFKLLKKIFDSDGLDVSESEKSRWLFIFLGVLLGCFGVHLAYAKRWFLFLMLWSGLIIGNVLSNEREEQKVSNENNEIVQNQDQSPEYLSNSNLIGNVGFAVWGLLWIGGTLFIKKDGKGNRM